MAEDRPPIPPAPALPWETAVAPAKPTGPPLSLLDAFDRLEKVFNYETNATRAAIIIVRDLVLDHYYRTNERLDNQARTLREHRGEIDEIRAHIGFPEKAPKDGL